MKKLHCLTTCNQGYQECDSSMISWIKTQWINNHNGFIHPITKTVTHTTIHTYKFTTSIWRDGMPTMFSKVNLGFAKVGWRKWRGITLWVFSPISKDSTFVGISPSNVQQWCANEGMGSSLKSCPLHNYQNKNKWCTNQNAMGKVNWL